MDKEQFIQELNDLLAEEFEVEVSAIQPSKSIKMTLALDSLSLIDLVAVIENIYKVKIFLPISHITQSVTNLYNTPKTLSL